MLQVGASSTPIRACQQPSHGRKTWTGGSCSIPQVCALCVLQDEVAIPAYLDSLQYLHIWTVLPHFLRKRSSKWIILVGELLCW